MSRPETSPAPAVGQRWNGAIPGAGRDAVDFETIEWRPGEHKVLVIHVPSVPRWGTGRNGDGMNMRVEWFSSCRYLGPTPSPAQPEQPPTPVAASSPVAGVGGRDGCAKWCGLPLLNDLVPGDACSFAFDEDPDQPGWCSPLCQGERRPPMGERKRPHRHGPACDCDAHDEEGASHSSGCSRMAWLRENYASFLAEVDQAMAQVAGDLAAQDWGAEPKPVATDPGLIAKIQRIRAHAIAEGGDSATRAAPGRTRDTFADLADEWDCLPDAGPVGQRR